MFKLKYSSTHLLHGLFLVTLPLATCFELKFQFELPQTPKFFISSTSITTITIHFNSKDLAPFTKEDPFHGFSFLYSKQIYQTEVNFLVLLSLRFLQSSLVSE
jgi:hypothetical protein